MKLSTLTITATLTLACASSFANEVVFRATDNNLATQTCIIAATDGLEAVRTLVESKDLDYQLYKNSVSCNDMSLRNFAKSFAKQDVIDASSQNKETEVVKLVASTPNKESQLCLDAVMIGESRARARHNIDGPVICNDQYISSFVRNFRNKEVQLLASED
jgi:hypothetical protein